MRLAPRDPAVENASILCGTAQSEGRCGFDRNALILCRSGSLTLLPSALRDAFRAQIRLAQTDPQPRWVSSNTLSVLCPPSSDFRRA